MRGLSSVTHLCARLLVGVTLAAPIGCEDEETSTSVDDDDRSVAPAQTAEIAQRVAEPVEPAPPGTSANLLQWAATREPLGADEPERTWRLPMKSKRIDVSLLRAAALDDLASLPAILTPDAQWGLPDRRMPGARPVFADGGEAFLAALRKSAARLPDKPQWETDMLMPGTTTAVRLGAEPMWSYFKQGWETILIRKVHRDGRAWIDYVGFFEELPKDPIKIDVKSWGYPPPSSPAWKMPDGSIRIPPKQRPRIDMRPPEGPADE